MICGDDAMCQELNQILDAKGFTKPQQELRGSMLLNKHLWKMMTLQLTQNTLNWRR